MHPRGPALCTFSTMHVKRITLTGFKSYKDSTVELGPGLNIVGA